MADGNCGTPMTDIKNDDDDNNDEESSDESEQECSAEKLERKDTTIKSVKSGQMEIKQLDLNELIEEDSENEEEPINKSPFKSEAEPIKDSFFIGGGDDESEEEESENENFHELQIIIN